MLHRCHQSSLGIGLLCGLLGFLTLTAAQGKEARERTGRTRQLWGIEWQPTLKASLKLAQETAEKEESRPLMHFRVLGDLTGFM